MATDYISRKSIEQIITGACDECKDECVEYDGVEPDCENCLLHSVKWNLDALPAADVRPVVRGEWLDFSGDQKCSVCGASFPDLYPLYDSASYCPNCGADMREVTP